MFKKMSFVLAGLLVFSVATAQEKVSVAVMDLEIGEGISEKTSKILSDSLRTSLVNTKKFTVVTRENVESVLKEQKFQLTGATEKTIAEAGRLLGAEKVIVGSVGKIGDIYLVNIKIIDVKLGIIEKAEKEEVPVEELLGDAINNIALKIAGLPTKPLAKGIIQPVKVEYDLRSKGSAFGAKIIMATMSPSVVLAGLSLKTFIDPVKGLEIDIHFVPQNVIIGDFSVAFHQPKKLSLYWGYGGNFFYTLGPGLGSFYNLQYEPGVVGFGLHAKGGIEWFVGKLGVFTEIMSGVLYGYNNAGGSGDFKFFYSLNAGARLYFSGMSIF